MRYGDIREIELRSDVRLPKYAIATRYPFAYNGRIL